jgi:hypothetical protein
VEARRLKMSTSEKAFEQVKSILGKLDRSIDAARQRRLQGTFKPVPAAPGASPAAFDADKLPPATPIRAQPIRLADRDGTR